MKLLNIIILLFICGSLSNCTSMNHDLAFTKPFSLTMEPPAGPPIYQKGFLEGCESGYSGYSNSFNKMFWRWNQDPELAQNETYYKIWKDAYAYCALYAMAADLHGYGNAR